MRRRRPRRRAAHNKLWPVISHIHRSAYVPPSPMVGHCSPRARLLRLFRTCVCVYMCIYSIYTKRAHLSRAHLSLYSLGPPPPPHARNTTAAFSLSAMASLTHADHARTRAHKRRHAATGCTATRTCHVVQDDDLRRNP